MPSFPDFAFEQKALDAGFSRIAGIDEVGRGPLAGGVVVASVILDPNKIPNGLQDSKKISAKKREFIFEEIMSTSIVSIASVSAAVIDKINIRQATLLAMTKASETMSEIADWHLIDGNAIPKPLAGRAEFVIKGDAKCLSIAAASIVAKVTRDRMMERASHFYPRLWL